MSPLSSSAKPLDIRQSAIGNRQSGTLSKYFLPYQAAWIKDTASLKIAEKARQVGLSYADSYDSVRLVSAQGARLDVYVSSRDEAVAKQYIRYCKLWAKILSLAAEDLGEIVIDSGKNLTASVLRFASGLSIYSLSSNPDALVGKPGHIKLDEFALHKDQRLLYRIAKPCTQWGGRLAVLSTHRGRGTVFNEILTGIREKGNPMGWSLHRITLQDAVDQGLVEKINQASDRSETREEFLARTKSECLDEEQWLQEYCCIPADDSAAFITYEMISSAETPGTMRDLEYLKTTVHPIYVGVDVGRKQDLTVIDVCERIGDVYHDRLRLEIRAQTFAAQEDILYTVLGLRQLRRCCIDATGLGMQLAERAAQKFGSRVEPVMFTARVKEELAYPLRAAFEDKRLRLNPDTKLAEDLRGIRKTTTLSGNIRFAGEAEDSHCDRFWALALRQHAAASPGGSVSYQSVQIPNRPRILKSEGVLC